MPGHIHAAQFSLQPSRRPPLDCLLRTLRLPALSQSTLLWEEVRIDWRVLQQQAAAGDGQQAALTPFAAAAAWLAARLPRVRRLVLLSCRSLPAPALQQVTNRLHKSGSCKPAAAHVHVKARAVGQASRQRRPAPAACHPPAALPKRLGRPAPAGGSDAGWRRRLPARAVAAGGLPAAGGGVDRVPAGCLGCAACPPSVAQRWRCCCGDGDRSPPPGAGSLPWRHPLSSTLPPRLWLCRPRPPAVPGGGRAEHAGRAARAALAGA